MSRHLSARTVGEDEQGAVDGRVFGEVIDIAYECRGMKQLSMRMLMNR